MESNLAFSDNLQKTLEERSAIWQSLDTSKKHAAEIEQLSTKVHSAGTVEDVTVLANAQKPPAEIFATLQQLESELKTVETSEKNIQEHQATIQEIRTKIRNRYITFISIVAVIVFIGFCMILRLFA